MKIVVTGGAGFIGSHIVDALVNKGHNVHIIDNLSTGKFKHINRKAKFHRVDIRNYARVKLLIKKTDVVFHTAALARIQPSIINPRESNDVNVTGTLNVLLAARDAKVRKFIYSASSSAYGMQLSLPLKETMVSMPKNPYAIQKMVGEIYCRNFYELYGLPTVCLRYFNVYGPRQTFDGAYASVIGIFLRQKKAGKSMTVVRDGHIKRRDYTHVSDIVKGNLLAMRRRNVGRGDVINLGTGKNYSVKEVAEAIGGRCAFIPKRLGEARETLASTSKAKRVLGWKAGVSFRDGINRLKEQAGII